jgi:hypothetical protein
MFFKGCHEAPEFAKRQASQTGLRHVGYVTFKWEYNPHTEDYDKIQGWMVKLHVEKGRTTPVRSYGNGFASIIRVKRSEMGNFIKRTTV